MFDKNLKNFRVYHGYTQKDLAELVGLSIYAIKEYEQGKREPNIARLVKLADVLNCSLDELVGRNIKE